MTREVRFIPIKHGGFVTLGNTGIPGAGAFRGTYAHKIVGFKPSPGKKREGWLVVLVDPKSGHKPQRRLKV